MYNELISIMLTAIYFATARLMYIAYLICEYIIGKIMGILIYYAQVYIP